MQCRWWLCSFKQCGRLLTWMSVQWFCVILGWAMATLHVNFMLLACCHVKVRLWIRILSLFVIGALQWQFSIDGFWKAFESPPSLLKHFFVDRSHPPHAIEVPGACRSASLEWEYGNFTRQCPGSTPWSSWKNRWRSWSSLFCAKFQYVQVVSSGLAVSVQAVEILSFN